MEPLVVDLVTAAQMLSVSPRTIRRLIGTRLRAVRIGRRILVPLDSPSRTADGAWMAVPDSNLRAASENLSDLKARLIESSRAEEIVSAVRGYLLKGWQPIPIPNGEKAPRLMNWQNLLCH